MGCRTQWYGPLVTSSGSSFWVIGPPQLRPMWTRAQIANPSPIANRTSPRPSRHASVFSAWSRKTNERTRTITMTAITAVIPRSREHRMRPLLAKKAATSQKIQSAAHPRAKVSSTARTRGVSPAPRLATTLADPARARVRHDTSRTPIVCGTTKVATAVLGSVRNFVCGLRLVDVESVAVGHCQDVQDALPARDLSGGVGSVRSAVADGQVEDLQGGLLGGEVPAPAGGLAEAGVQGLDSVRGVDQLPDLDGEVEERHELGPGPLPHRDHRGVLRSPGRGEVGEPGLGGRDAGAGVHLLELGRDLGPVLLGHVPQRVADQ